VLLYLPLLSQQLQLCASPPRFRVFGVSFHPPGFLLRLLSCAPSTLYSTWVLFFFLVSFPWFWVSLSSFLCLLSPLLEPSLLFFLLSVRSLLGAVAVTPPKKKRLQRVIVVDGATHSHKDGVESNGGSLKGDIKAFMLFLGKLPAIDSNLADHALHHA